MPRRFGTCQTLQMSPLTLTAADDDDGTGKIISLNTYRLLISLLPFRAKKLPAIAASIHMLASAYGIPYHRRSLCVFACSYSAAAISSRCRAEGETRNCHACVRPDGILLKANIEHMMLMLPPYHFFSSLMRAFYRAADSAISCMHAAERVAYLRRAARYSLRRHAL